MWILWNIFAHKANSLWLLSSVWRYSSHVPFCILSLHIFSLSLSSTLKRDFLTNSIATMMTMVRKLLKWKSAKKTVWDAYIHPMNRSHFMLHGYTNTQSLYSNSHEKCLCPTFNHAYQSTSHLTIYFRWKFNLVYCLGVDFQFLAFQKEKTRETEWDIKLLKLCTCFRRIANASPHTHIVYVPLNGTRADVIVFLVTMFNDIVVHFVEWQFAVIAI